MNKKITKSKVCPFCEKIYRTSGSVCKDCSIKISKIEEKAHSKYKLSLSKINSLRVIYKQNDILEYLLNNPQLIYQKIDTTNSKSWFRYRKFQLQENSKVKGYSKIPLYVKQFFDEHRDLSLINIVGNKEDPFITFICKKCNEEHIMHFSNIKKGPTHRCDANISSGEFAIKQYLKDNNYKFKTQLDTLSCKNPKTGRPLPYDFEITGYKILIEVQGEQHNTFIPYFHSCLEDFEYQVYKDKIKKEYAEKRGYQLIYLYYSDIENKKYIDIINKAISSSKTF